MIRFDRAAPGEGMIIYSRIENEKAYLEFQFFLKIGDGKAEQLKIDLTEYLAEIRIYDRDNSSVSEIMYPLCEEEPAKGMLLHPHLWKPGPEPYLYSVKVHIIRKENNTLKEENQNISLDRLEKQLPLRTFETNPKKGYVLNGEAFTPRPVFYRLAERVTNEISGRECLHDDLRLLWRMGANTIVLGSAEYNEDFLNLCDETGFLVWYREEVTADIPKINELLPKEKELPSDLYYYYKACWGREPFVYPVRNSLKRQKNGTYSLLVYSNQKRVALYIDGVLFEFQNGAPDFLFEEIPAGKYPLQLTAETGDLSVSLTVYF